VGWDSLEQGSGQVDIQHGAFVNDQKINVKGILFILIELANLPFQQTMNRLGFSANHIDHSLSRSAGGGRQ
jgi:hypothetical protein